jgi:hypothetical protein
MAHPGGSALYRGAGRSGARDRTAKGVSALGVTIACAKIGQGHRALPDVIV